MPGVADQEPCRPILVALEEEIPPGPGESWRDYRQRVAQVLEPVRRRASRVLGLTLEPLFSANALHGQGSEAAVQEIRRYGLGDGMTLVEWGEERRGEQMDALVRETGLDEGLPQTGGLTGQGVTVAVLDSGIDARHRFLSVAAAVSTCPEPRGAPGRHGTLCAGIIASRSHERPGIAPGVRLLDVKVARATGWTTPGWLAQGIDAALDLEADILSISLGLNLLPASSPEGHGWLCPDGRCVLCRAADHAVACGAVVVTAAGNEHLRALFLARRGVKLPSGTEVLCPGRSSGALTVGALDKPHLRRVYPTSSRGAGKPDLVAPGADVTSTVLVPPDWRPARRFDLFGTGSGTSVAAAVVAGAVALLLEGRRAAGRSYSPADIRRELLAEHTLPIDLPGCPPDAQGAGALNLSALRSPFNLCKEIRMQEIASEPVAPPIPLALAPEAAPAPPNLSKTGYLFTDLQKDPEALLPANPSTVEFLTRLGATMREESGREGPDSRIPSAYTYFGQFVNHDIMRELPLGSPPNLFDPQLAPMAEDGVWRISNRRSAPLDLDSVYDAAAPRDGHKMKVGTVQAFGQRPPGAAQDDLLDLPRTDRTAEIGDSRNDENLIIAQLHLAFLRAHNKLVDQEGTFRKARIRLLQHYHWIVLHDFLPRIADPDTVAATLQRPRFYDMQQAPQFFLPLEFTVAAFRFGHSMVRHIYHYNSNVPQATLGQLFALTTRGRLSLTTGETFNTLPASWIIGWENFLGDRPPNRARRIGTRLVEPLFELKNVAGPPQPPGPVRLAVLDLLRGYLLRMPCGQAVAKAMGFSPLSPAQIEKAAANDEQRAVLQESGFSGRTPLWFYILAEAAHHRRLHGKDRLGPVGSTLVAEVLIGLVRKSEHSILNVPGWRPDLGQEGSGRRRFGLADLLRFAGVLP